MQRRDWPKNDEAKAFRLVQRSFYGDALKDEATALAVAEVLIRSTFSEDELQRQQPLTIKDEGDSWSIEGSVNKDRTEVGTGAVFVKLEKANATVQSLFLRLVMPPAETASGTE